MAQQDFKRSKKLVNKGLQLRLVGSFGAVAFLAMVLQFLFVGFFLMRSVSTLENGAQLASQVPGALVSSLVASLVLLTPLFILVGIMVTFRIAGPAYRLEQYLTSLSKGEKMGPCKIRKGDYLQSVCDAVNLAAESMQTKNVEDELETKHAA